MNQQYCRCCCLEYPALTYSIFEDNIQAELMECVPCVSVLPGDGLPEIICDLCWLRLREAVEFRRKCEQTDLQLRQLCAEQMPKSVAINEHNQNVECNLICQSGQERLNDAAALEAADDSDNNDRSSTLNEDEISMLADILLEDYSFSNSPIDANTENYACSEDTIITELLNKAFSDPTLALDSCTPAATQSGCNVTPTPCEYQPLSENKIIEPSKQPANKGKERQRSTFGCTICAKHFTRNFQLRLHMISVHKVGDGLQYKCEICYKLFASRHSLSYHHKSMHSTERPYPCSYCERRFILRSQLISHMRTHTGDFKPRIYACHECGKSWPTMSDLRTHMRSHSPHMDRPFKCKNCEKCFFTRGHLNAHMLVHTGEKPYVCQHCQKSYQSVGNLNNHINRRHKKVLCHPKELFL